ncbi:MAG: hypothetical protein H5T66_11885 [Chloroflexi bacterium]|nr:hypothetical protein [Chloroflexota bacterium]
MSALVAFFKTPFGSALLALLVPIAWGLASAWLFDRLRERSERRRSCDLPTGGRDS